MIIKDAYLEINLFSINLQVKNEEELLERIKLVLSQDLEVVDKNIEIKLTDKRID